MKNNNITAVDGQGLTTQESTENGEMSNSLVIKLVDNINQIFIYIAEDGFKEFYYTFILSERLKNSIEDGEGRCEFIDCVQEICSDQWRESDYEVSEVYLSVDKTYIVVKVQPSDL